MSYLITLSPLLFENKKCVGSLGWPPPRNLGMVRTPLAMSGFLEFGVQQPLPNQNFQLAHILSEISGPYETRGRNWGA